MFLTGRSKPEVKYSDLSPATTATISGDRVTIPRQRPYAASACVDEPESQS